MGQREVGLPMVSMRALGSAILLAAGASLLLSACETPIRVRGQMPDPEIVEAISPGVHSRQDVVELLGSPSTISTFQDRKWYYIGQKSTQFAYKKPTVLERSILVVTFDGTGYVDGKTVYGLEDGRDIDPVARITPTEGRELTVLQQLLGNLGKLPSGAGQPKSPDVP